MSIPRFRLAFAAGLLAAACSSTTSSFVGGDRSDGGPSEGSGAGGRGGADGGRTDAGATDVPPTMPTKVGRIYAGQTITIVNGTEYYSSYATAMFYEIAPGGGGSSCTYAKHGSCHVYDCPLSSSPPDAGGPRYAGAGTVSLTGGFTTYSLDIDPGSYKTISSQQLLYESGTVLRVSSTGDEVPAFSNKSITVPSTPFAVTSPDLDSPLALSRNQALALTWSGAGNRDVQVAVSTTQTNVRSVSIQCTFPGAGGSATVPATALKKLLPTNASTKGFLSIGAPVETAFKAGEWQVTFGLTPNPHTSEFATAD